jgi:hypothetical protein
MSGGARQNCLICAPQLIIAGQAPRAQIGGYFALLALDVIAAGDWRSAEA